MMRAVFIYMVTSFFRRSPTPATDVKTGAPGVALPPSSNLYPNGTLFDLYLYASEDQKNPNFDDALQLLWFKRDLTYGDWKSGPDSDGIYTKEVTIPLSEVYCV